MYCALTGASYNDLLVAVHEQQAENDGSIHYVGHQFCVGIQTILVIRDGRHSKASRYWDYR
jgi:hypothetical protein